MHMQKRFSIFFLLLTLFSSAFSNADAHVLETNKTVGAVIHITPDDSPVANQPSEIYFEFKDTENKFSPEACTCIVTIRQGEKEIHKEQLFQDNPSLENAVMTYTFPQEGKYTLSVTGNPNDQSFNQFDLKYEVVVKEAVQKKESISQTQENWMSTHRYHVLGVLVIMGILGTAIILNYHKSRKRHLS